MRQFFPGDKEIRPLSYGYYWGIVLTLAVLGLADSIYLSISHYRVYTDIGYRSFCAISKAVNCDTVSQSPYSIFAGLPVPVWGIVGYSLLLLVVFLARGVTGQRKRAWSLIFAISMAFSVYSVVLAFISSYLIHSYCIMCLVAYGINFWLWLDLQFIGLKKNWSYGVFLPFALVVGLAIAVFPEYWKMEAPASSEAFQTGLTSDGHPWIGDENATLQIVEFSDYQCFQCKKMHFFLRQLVAQHPGRIKLIHRHFPMDDRVNPMVKEPFHVGSGYLALLAIYAASKGKFWEMNDELYALVGHSDNIELSQLGEKLGLDADEMTLALGDRNIRSRLWRDIREGLRLGISGTPSYLIDEKLYSGEIPPFILKKAIP